MHSHNIISESGAAISIMNRVLVLGTIIALKTLPITNTIEM